MKPGYATPEGTARFAARFPSHRGFYREVQGLHVSTLGLGTYLGQPDDATDRAYTEAATAALQGGVNFLDAAINYRDQRSERCLGAAIRDLSRDEIVLCTKAGFLTPGAMPELLTDADVVGGMHSMSPDFLEDQCERSRANLGVETLDVFYLHNPETQLNFVPLPEFRKRLRAAFERLETLAARGRIRAYGTATWDGFRLGQLDLAEIAEIAREAGGGQHRFRFVQLPFNLAMVEAYATRDSEGRNLLELAAQLGISIIASASMLQARLARNLPEQLAARLPGLTTDAQRAIQFTRSTPGVAVALAGMSQTAHVRENLVLADAPPLAPAEYAALYGPAH